LLATGASRVITLSSFALASSSGAAGAARAPAALVGPSEDERDEEDGPDVTVSRGRVADSAPCWGTLVGISIDYFLYQKLYLTVHDF
jgi:hypothetical protein